MQLWYIRKKYLDKILNYLDNVSLIKVLIWQRRVWKSYIMKQIIDFIINVRKVNQENILYINLETDYLKFKDVIDLNDFILEYIESRKLVGRIYLFIDEIQEINWWEKLINSYRANDKLDMDIFITWSNANLLSSELSTYLAWRYISFEIYPFLYDEYLWYYDKNKSFENFLEYLNGSGISELYKIQEEEWKINFLKSLKDTIILKDIVKRYNIKDIDLLERLFLYLSWNIGTLFSLNSIVRKLKSIKLNSNTNTIWNYINFLEKTYVIHWVNRYDLKWKKILEWEKKYYLNDLAFNNYFSSTYDIWWWRKLENIVYNYLKFTWYTVYVGNIWNLEIDFVAEKWKERIYIQVAYLITDNAVLEREFGNLLKINDNYPKYVLSLDKVLINDYKWVIHMNIEDFILE